MKFKKDKRKKISLAEWELNIQKRAENKDANFLLFLARALEASGVLTFVKEQDGFRIYRVDGEWLRNNLIPDFEHAGHGFVHLPIPMDEIWVDIRHYKGCNCREVGQNRRLSQKFFESTGAVHEPAEFKKMEKGMTYWRAHQIALEEEKKAGILKDPYTEEYTEQ